MPYFVTDKQTDCPAWATVKEEANGNFVTVACHETKQQAIDQMVAISIGEGIVPGGERDAATDYVAAELAEAPESLCDLVAEQLADVIQFRLRAHGYHWNVRGIDFAQYHELFESIYEDANESIDPLAEILLKLGYDAPYRMSDLRALSELVESEIVPDTPIDMATDLLAANDEIILGYKEAIRAATDEDEQGVVNFLADRLDTHQKWSWQLRASIGVQPQTTVPGQPYPTMMPDSDPAVRNLDGPKAMLCDVDDTLIIAGNLNTSVADFVNKFVGELIIVTARMESRRAETVKQLKDVKYDELVMRQTNEPEVSYKDNAARDLMDKWNIQLAIDNNAGVRAAYAKLGIDAIAPEKVNERLVFAEDQDSQAYADSLFSIEDDAMAFRALDLTPPVYMQDAALKGIMHYEAGDAGTGLRAQTLREAHAMAHGNVTADKWRRMVGWIARHMVDLQDLQPGEITPGVVAHLLWGSGPSLEDAKRALAYAQDVVKRLDAASGEQRSGILFHMENGVETRRICINDFEMRDSPNGDGMRFTGYAAVFNSDSEPLPFIERIAPGAFGKSLQSRNDVKLFMNHNTDFPLASKRSGTLSIVEDGYGLRVEAELPPTQAGRDLSTLMQSGVVDSMSFGFSVPPGGDWWAEDGQTRELREIRLHEVSIVTGFPAYEATSATVRSLDGLQALEGIDQNVVADAIAKLTNGDPLSADEADLICGIAEELAGIPEETTGAEADDNAPPTAPSVDKGTPMGLGNDPSMSLREIEARRQHLALLMRRV